VRVQLRSGVQRATDRTGVVETVTVDDDLALADDNSRPAGEGPPFVRGVVGGHVQVGCGHRPGVFRIEDDEVGVGSRRNEALSAQPIEPGGVGGHHRDEVLHRLVSTPGRPLGT
jgi:hypothetical protein